MRYQDYIWDLGGTLLDNYEASARAFQACLEAYGRPSDHAAIYQALKISTDFACETYASDLPDFLAHYKELEAQYLLEPILFEHAQEVLATICRKGGRNFMISHRNRQVLDILDRAHISDYFEAVVTADDGFARKPSPEAIQYLDQQYQLVRPVMIGDRQIDIEAGQGAGIATLFFDSKASCVQATRSIHSLKEVLE